MRLLKKEVHFWEVKNVVIVHGWDHNLLSTRGKCLLAEIWL